RGRERLELIGAVAIWRVRVADGDGEPVRHGAIGAGGGELVRADAQRVERLDGAPERSETGGRGRRLLDAGAHSPLDPLHETPVPGQRAARGRLLDGHHTFLRSEG